MTKTNLIQKTLLLLLFIFTITSVNAQVSDALLTAEMNNGNNPESTEITGPNWK